MNNIQVFESFKPKGKSYRVDWSKNEDQVDVKILDGTTVIFEINGNGFFQENGIDVNDTAALENVLKTMEIIGENDTLRKGMKP